MFGIADPGIYFAYLMVFLCILFAAFYGIRYWNKGNDEDEESVKSDLKWAKRDNKFKRKLVD